MKFHEFFVKYRDYSISRKKIPEFAKTRKYFPCSYDLPWKILQYSKSSLAKSTISRMKVSKLKLCPMVNCQAKKKLTKICPTAWSYSIAQYVKVDVITQAFPVA